MLHNLATVCCVNTHKRARHILPHAAQVPSKQKQKTKEKRKTKNEKHQQQHLHIATLRIDAARMRYLHTKTTNKQQIQALFYLLNV